MSSFFSRRSVCKLLASVLAGTMCTGGVSFASGVSKKEVGVQADLPSSSGAGGQKASESGRNGKRGNRGGSGSRRYKNGEGTKSSGKSGVARPKFVALSEFEALKERVGSLEALKEKVASLEAERGSSKWITAMKFLGVAMALNRGVQFVTSSDIADWVLMVINPEYKALVLEWLKDGSFVGWFRRIKAFIPIPFIREYELLSSVVNDRSLVKGAKKALGLKGNLKDNIEHLMDISEQKKEEEAKLNNE